MTTRRIALAAWLLTIAGTLHAADWPSRPIVVLDGFAPGGGTDVFMRVMALPAIRERFAREGAEPVGSPPAEFAVFVQSEVTRWTEVARKAGLKPES